MKYKGRVRSVLGYRLEVNGRLSARLGPTSRNFVLKKCRPCIKYSCVLTIITVPGVCDGKRLVEVSYERNDKKRAKRCAANTYNVPFKIDMA